MEQEGESLCLTIKLKKERERKRERVKKRQSERESMNEKVVVGGNGGQMYIYKYNVRGDRKSKIENKKKTENMYHDVIVVRRLRGKTNRSSLRQRRFILMNVE